jgi:hypothetical protein
LTIEVSKSQQILHYWRTLEDAKEGNQGFYRKWKNSQRNYGKVMQLSIEMGKSMFQTARKSMIAFYMNTTICQMWVIQEYIEC